MEWRYDWPLLFVWERKKLNNRDLLPILQWSGGVYVGVKECGMNEVATKDTRKRGRRKIIFLSLLDIKQKAVEDGI